MNLQNQALQKQAELNHMKKIILNSPNNKRISSIFLK